MPRIMTPKTIKQKKMNILPRLTIALLLLYPYFTKISISFLLLSPENVNIFSVDYSEGITSSVDIGKRIE